ncbi:MAG: glycosyltransferase family 2 protein [Actinobacteria bacterium]|nr:glycosyltransferase family 2 protein [Actinomycetota bacterium]MBU1609360.1 glycosyltransferase family 2 protein [Actinomycetota bacterium]MBU2314992.1 glycosyltransferase family 2 protein [Actinomycetota bacterium]MBU2385042.1 glycosyltransferase family 2 protein [Actinomycetota bacterium]
MRDAPAAVPPGGPAVEVIVPVHDRARPLARAVASVAESGLSWGEQVIVTVVAHNLPIDAVDGMLEGLPAGTVVTVLACDDGLPSPAGPRTLALERSRARYVSFLDSDDWFEPGALAHWLRLAERHGLAAVIAPERHASGRVVLNPPVRPLHVGALHPRRDRLPYRTALRGLLERAAVLDEGLRFSTGVTNGSDQPVSLGLWFSGRPLRFASRAPAYVLGDDAPSRVTRTPQPLDAEVAASAQLLRGPWFRSLALRDRQLVAAKMVRIHLLPGLALRTLDVTDDKAAHECAHAAAFLHIARDAAPGLERSLSRTDERLVEQVLAAQPDLPRVRDLLAQRRRFTRPSTLLTRRLGDALRRDAPLRLAAASALLPLRLRLRRAATRPNPDGTSTAPASRG